MDEAETLRSELIKALADCNRLRAENAELKRRLAASPAKTLTLAPAAHLSCDPEEAGNQSGSSSREGISGDSLVPATGLTARSKPDLKVALFMQLFRGRDDVYAVRWEARDGRAGYSPAGLRDWRTERSGANGRRQPIKHMTLFSLTEEVIKDHLTGRQTIGLYPLLPDDTCWFVAVDFDKKSWQTDALAFMTTCRKAGAPAALE